jgi:hypothetical protein
LGYSLIVFGILLSANAGTSPTSFDISALALILVGSWLILNVCGDPLLCRRNIHCSAWLSKERSVQVPHGASQIEIGGGALWRCSGGFSAVE